MNEMSEILAGISEEEEDPQSTAELKDAPVREECGFLIAISRQGGAASCFCFRVERGGQATIGRDEGCEIVVNDRFLSRRHLRVSSSPGGVLIEDLGSMNGARYLGKQIERIVLPIGAEIAVGALILNFLPLSSDSPLPSADEDRYQDLLGASLPMRRLYALLKRLEKADVPVLIEGESGTGKELVAQAIHQRGPRAGRPLLTIDCGAMPAKLMESQLFGHKKGAFTGTIADAAGAFEAAHQGTVFLDEIGELPLELQPKLLRVLDSGQMRRIGDSVHSQVDVRVIAATRRSLEEEVRQGRFREDLYYRLAVLRLIVPPLRERKEDIRMLVSHFVTLFRAQALFELPTEALEAYLQDDWPGNVRQLRNVVCRAMLVGTNEPSVSRSRVIRVAPREETAKLPRYHEAKQRTSKGFERDYLLKLVERFGGNLSQMARISGVSRKALRDMLRKHDMYPNKTALPQQT